MSGAVRPRRENPAWVTGQALSADDLAERYRAGESLLSLSRESGVGRFALASQLRSAGVELRGVAESQRLRAGRPADKVPLYNAADECGINRKALARAVRAGRVRATRVDEPGRSARYHVDLDELRGDLAALPRCRWPGCDQPALLPDDTCGTCGGGRRQPRTPPGTVALRVAAAECSVNRRALRRVIQAGHVRATVHSRPGTGTRYELVLADLEQVPLCSQPGCEHPAVHPSGMCELCALRTSIATTLDDEGLVAITSAARDLGYTPQALVLGPKLPIVRREFGRIVRLAARADHVVATARTGKARQQLGRKLSKPLSVLHGTERGRPSIDSLRPGTSERIAELHAAGLSLRAIASELGVSKSHVDRAVQAYLAAVPKP